MLECSFRWVLNPANLMAAQTDQIAIWVLGALKQEWERDPSHLTCSTEATVLGPLKSKHKINDSDIDRGIRFLIDRGLIDGVQRKDGRAALPSAAGLNYLAAYFAAKAERKKANFDRRVRIYTLIIAIIGLGIALATYFMKR